MLAEQSIKTLVVFLLVVTIAYLVYLLSPVLTPFLISAILAYIGDPVVDRLETYKIPRSVAVTIAFSSLVLVSIIVLFILLPLIEDQLTVFSKKIPEYINWFETIAVPWLQANLGQDMDYSAYMTQLRQSLAENWLTAGSVIAFTISSVTTSGLLLMAWLANLVLIPVVTFYLLRDWDILVSHLHQLIPKKVEPIATRLAQQSDEVLGSFFKGQLLVMIGLASIYSLGLWAMGLDLALLIGLLAGLVSFVPYLGFIVGIGTAGIAALIQFQDVSHILMVFGVFGFGQIIESFVLTPLLVGDRIGLHPVAVIFAVMAGGQLFGFFGILLALPVASVIMVLLRYTHKEYKASGLYNSG